MAHPDRQSFSARYVFPGDAPPLERATVEITGGVISAVHDRRDQSAVDLGNVAVIPGLVNAHTHLEFSNLTEPIPRGKTFRDWIRGVVAHRRGRTGSAADAIRQGLTESIQGGVTALGEIATDDDAALRGIPHSPQCVLFRELLGFLPYNIEPQLAIARSFLDVAARTSRGQRSEVGGQESEVGGQRSEVVGQESDGRRGAALANYHSPMPSSIFHRPSSFSDRGLSPHAPYSVHPDLFIKLVELAVERDVPLAVHLAETRDELEFLDHGRGPLVDMLRDFGIWQDGVVARGTTPMDYLRLLADAPRALVVHGNYLNDEELRFVAGRGNLSLVYCPRTHAYFGHEPHPFRAVLARGGNVALGTDSRASNPDLSLWRELCFLRRANPDLPDAEVLRLGTVNGAIALGMRETCGSLRAGRSADLCVIRLEGDATAATLFHSDNAVCGTMRRGEWAAGGPWPHVAATSSRR